MKYTLLLLLLYAYRQIDIHGIHDIHEPNHNATVSLKNSNDADITTIPETHLSQTSDIEQRNKEISTSCYIVRY